MNKVQYYELIEPAIAIVVKKDQDYNSTVTRESYFPFGDKSYAQMIHVKSQRLVNLSESAEKPNFESVKDTVLDLVNYAVFYLDFLSKEQTK